MSKLSKKEFDKLYIGEKIVVHCHTEELANKFLKEAHEHGYEWGLSNKDKYDRKNCYRFIDKYISAGNFYFYFRENYKIVDFKCFDKIEKNKQETYICETLPHKNNTIIRNTRYEIIGVQDTNFENEECKVIFNDLATIVILEDGSKGVARCNPNDIYDLQKGVDIAYKRALIKSLYKQLDRLVK